MTRWLLLSNCQTFGFANSMMLANSRLTVDGVDIWTYKTDPARHNAAMADYDRVIVHPDVALLPEFDRSGTDCLNYLPSLEFGAYHPDTAYFLADGAFINGPMTAYQSILAVAAYEEGLSLADTRALFTGKIYEACGYMLDWAPQREALVQSFRDHGVDIAGPFQRWGRERAFMFSINHPRIEAVNDVACAFLRALHIDVTETDVIPLDNLMVGPCMPVYPEVGEALGVRGSYLFKATGEYRYYPLDHYLAESFKVYAGFPRGAIQPLANYRQRYDRVLSVVRGHA